MIRMSGFSYVSRSRVLNALKLVQIRGHCAIQDTVAVIQPSVDH